MFGATGKKYWFCQGKSLFGLRELLSSCCHFLVGQKLEEFCSYICLTAIPISSSNNTLLPCLCLHSVICFGIDISQLMHFIIAHQDPHHPPSSLSSSSFPPSSFNIPRQPHSHVPCALQSYDLLPLTFPSAKIVGGPLCPTIIYHHF